MLSKLLQEFRNSKDIVNLNELCRVLNVERSALDEMINMLVRQGKLKEVPVHNLPCGNCAGCHGCVTAQDSITQGKTWELVLYRHQSCPGNSISLCR